MRTWEKWELGRSFISETAEDSVWLQVGSERGVEWQEIKLTGRGRGLNHGAGILRGIQAFISGLGFVFKTRGTSF